MLLTNLFPANGVTCDVQASSKKQLFQELAALLLKTAAFKDADIHTRDIVSAAMERERLGSTGVGSGVALPHARLHNIDGVHAVFARLETPMDYESIDDRPVDLVAMLIAPSDAGGEHLRALAQISRRLRREDVRARLRAAPSQESLYISLTDESEATAA